METKTYTRIELPNNPSEYDKQAHVFLDSCGAVIYWRYEGWKKYFVDDTEKRNVYTISIKRGGDSIEFTFGQSLRLSENMIPPTAYDILTCIEKTIHDSFEDFCADYGYDTDSRKAEKIFHACQSQAKEVNEIFGDVMEQLQEIC